MSDENETGTHREIMNHYSNYLMEEARFEQKGVKAAATRARKHLGEIGKLVKIRRAEIQEKKNNMYCQKYSYC